MNIKPYQWRHSSKVLNLDSKDRIILSALANKSYDSHSSLAKILNIPNSTLRYRLKRLEKIVVIRDCYYIRDLSQFGMLRFKIFIYAKGMNQNLTKKLFKFCAEQSNIDIIFSTSGSYEYELLVQAEDYLTVTKLGDSLREKFQDKISKVSIVPTFLVYKFSNYPFFTKNF